MVSARQWWRLAVWLALSACGEDITTVDGDRTDHRTGLVGATWAGQSLAFGKSRRGARANPVKYGGLMLDTSLHRGSNRGDRDRFVPMDTGSGQFNAGEVAFSDTLQEIVAAEGGDAISDQPFEIFAHNVAVGNTSAAGLLGRSVSYQDLFLPDLLSINAALANGSKTLSGRWVSIRRQGEADERAETDPGRYRGLVIIEQASRSSDMSRVFGQDIDLDLISYQFTSHGHSGVSSNGIPVMALALRDLSVDESLPIYLSNPTYLYEHYDGVHLLASGYERLASVEALVAKRILFDNVRPEPVAIRAAWVSGNDIILRYGLERGRSLVLDTSVVSDPGNFGFELYRSDGSTAIEVTSVSVTGTNEVTLTTTSPRSAGEIVRYAYTPRVAQVSGPTEGPRGCLRDDTPLTAEIDETTYPLHRYAAVDEFTVSASAGEPPAWRNINPHGPKTLPQIASDHGLAALYDLHTDADTSRFNHAENTLSTLMGTPTFDDQGVTFEAGAYIDTGLVETRAFTLFAVVTPSAGTYNVVSCYAGGAPGGSIHTGLANIEFGINVPRLRVGGVGGERASTSSLRFTELQSGPALAVFGTYDDDVSTTASLMYPRYSAQGVAQGEIGDGAAREYVNTNWIIGDGIARIHAVAIAAREMTFEEQARLYRDMMYALRSRGVYL